MYRSNLPFGREVDFIDSRLDKLLAVDPRLSQKARPADLCDNLRGYFHKKANIRTFVKGYCHKQGLFPGFCYRNCHKTRVTLGNCENIISQILGLRLVL